VGLARFGHLATLPAPFCNTAVALGPGGGGATGGVLEVVGRAMAGDAEVVVRQVPLTIGNTRGRLKSLISPHDGSRTATLAATVGFSSLEVAVLARDGAALWVTPGCFTLWLGLTRHTTHTRPLARFGIDVVTLQTQPFVAHTLTAGTKGLTHVPYTLARRTTLATLPFARRVHVLVLESATRLHAFPTEPGTHRRVVPGAVNAAEGRIAFTTLIRLGEVAVASVLPG